MSAILNARYFFALISSAVNGTTPPEAPDGTNWEGMFALAKKHEIAALMSLSVQKLAAKPPENMLKCFEEAQLKAISLDCIQRADGNAILSAFEENGIDCMPLKGWILKELYPAPYIRTMCDIDILFKSDRDKDVLEIMTSLGYIAEELGGNPDVYSKPPVTSIEMHKALIQDKTDHFARSWERAVLREGCSHIYDMSREDFYVFMMAHLKKHYIGAGTGLRSVLDIWLYNRRYSDTLDHDYINGKFEASGFGDFPEKICKISEMWFGGATPDESLKDMELHLLTSGAYGFDRFSQSEYIEQEKKKYGVLLYTLKLAFPGKEIMCERYPFVKKAPFLLPAAWLMRGFSSCIFGTKKTFALLKKVFHKSE